MSSRLLSKTSLRDGAISNLNEGVLVPLLLAVFFGRRLTWWRTPSTLRANARKAIRETAGSRSRKSRSTIASVPIPRVLLTRCSRKR